MNTDTTRIFINSSDQNPDQTATVKLLIQNSVVEFLGKSDKLPSGRRCPNKLMPWNKQGTLAIYSNIPFFLRYLEIDNPKPTERRTR